MTVLVTGGTGFVGLNLAEALLARGEPVVLAGLDQPPAPALRRFRQLPGTLATETVDVRDGAALEALFRRHQVTRLFPFAAVTSGPDRESVQPEAVFHVNLLGLIAQLQAARAAGVWRVIVPSSSSVYGEAFYRLPELDEDAACVPVSLYGISKFAVERTGLRLGALWGLDVIAARIGALFGPWERDTGLRDTLSPFWQAAQLALQRREAALPETLPTYSFVYARDAAAALLWLLDLRDPPHRVFNICGGVDLRSALPGFCARLAQAFPGFRYRTSHDSAEVNVQPSDPRPRGRMATGRLAHAGWTAAYGEDRACADYLYFLEHAADGPDA
ncbi:MAG: NAD(P)-dependent oxidoreductase [Acetobacteraceae bacterium]|nr:NAD(P)-dependent oxidoreductase [Acetobacteraceae bacterium]